MPEEEDERVLLARERTALAVERNRLANERTYLSWIRTGLASVGGGLAIIRFLTFQHAGNQIASQFSGCALVLLGISLFVLSYLDYKKSYESLHLDGGFAGPLRSVKLISGALILISIIMLIVFIKTFES